MAEPGAGAAPVAPAAANPQALIAKHAAETQSAGDAAIVQRVENSIRHSPLGWLQAQMGEVNAKASSEGGEINGKVAEHKQLIADNQSKAPADAGPPPAPGHATHPAVPHTATPTPVAATPKPAGGGAAAPAHAAPAASVQSAAPAAPAVEGLPAALATQLATASGDPQIDALLNAFTPKSEEVPATLGRISQMGQVARGFSGTLEVYVAQGGAVERAAAGAANFLGVGKTAGAIWANNPYRQMHTSLSGIMSGMSAVKNVASLVGSICNKIGMILTVVGLLGMIFPPIGAAVSGVARILNVVGIICEAIGLVLSSILVGLNGVQLAQQIASGASAEEKAATADMLMSETTEAAGGLLSLAGTFGKGFMNGLLKSSKGIIGSLIRRAKAVIGQITGKVSASVSSFVSKISRKLGFGGANAQLVGGQWVEKPGMFSKVSAAVSTVPERIQGVQDKLMAKYGDTNWAKRLDRIGAWSTSTAERFNLEDKLDKAGENLGSKINGLGANTGWSRRFNLGTDTIEAETKAAAIRAAAENAGDLERTRWENENKRRQAAGEAVTADPTKKGQQATARTETELERQEKIDAKRERLEAQREARSEADTERGREEYAKNEGRDEVHDKVGLERERRQRIAPKREEAIAERDALLARGDTLTAAERGQLTITNKRIAKFDSELARADGTEEKFSKLVGNGEEGQRRMENWSDVKFNLQSHNASYSEFKSTKDEDESFEAGVEWTKKHASVGRNAEGENVSVEESQFEGTRERAQTLATFVRAAPQRSTLGSRARTLLANTGRAQRPQAKPGLGTSPTPTPTAPAATTASATPAPAAKPPVHEEPPATAAAPAVANEEGGAGPGQETAGAGPGAGAEPPAAGGDALPFWPALMPQFEKAGSDFDYMRRVAVEFKKAQIEGKQKAVNILGIYGKYNEYAALRRAQATEQAASAHQTSGETQANQAHAGAGTQAAGQGEAKQNEAKGQANNRAAVDLPEPETGGFWGRLLGGIKIWAKNKAAAIFGWIQDKIASLILQGLCGVSMGDLRDYTGALRRQQAAAHHVADGAAETSHEAGGKQVKLGSDANQASQEAVKSIAECDQNLADAEAFLGDVTTFEAQLAEQKASAQSFIAQVHAAVAAEQARKKQEAAQQAQQAASAQATAQRAAQTAGPATPPATPEGTPAAEPAYAPVAGSAEPEQAEERDELASEQIHAAIEMVSSQSEGMVQQLEARGEDYINQLAVADKKGKSKTGENLGGPAKKQSKHIVEEFKKAAEEAKQGLTHIGQSAITPSSARQIADSVIESAEHLDTTFDDAQQALDELFQRTYSAIRAGRDEVAAKAPTPAPAPAAAPPAAPPT